MEVLSRPGIYRLVFPDGSYVGQSNNVKSRLSQHFTKIGDGIHPNHKIRAGVAMHGWPKAEVLEYCALEALNDAEIHWMDVYDCYPNGYNLKPGGGFSRAKEVEVYRECRVSPEVGGANVYVIYLLPLAIWIMGLIAGHGPAAFLIAAIVFIVLILTAEEWFRDLFN